MSAVRVIGTEYGKARVVLARVIAEGRGSDPLAPVTVVVPSNLVALDVRRWLVRERPVANVRFLVVERLAELAAAPRLQARGMRPRTRWLWLEHLRVAAAASGGRLGELADHPATLRRLAALASDLKGAPAEVIERLEAHPEPLVAEAVRVVLAARRATRDLYDDHDLVVEAAAAFREGDPAVREAGTVIFYLPDRMTRAAAELARAAGATVILGLTGDREVDSRSAAWCRLLGADPPGGPPAPRLPGRLASLPDPEEEVRFATREVWRLAEAGIPLHRMAILYGNAEQYASLVHDRLEASGTPHNGPGLRTLGESLAGRAVLGALRAARSEWRRDAVADWLTSAPLVVQGEEVPGHAWDTLSREAGVVRGLGQWQRAEAVVRAGRAARAADSPGLEAWRDAGAAEAKRMAMFVADAADRFDGRRALTVAAWARTAAAALAEWLPRSWLARFNAGAGGGLAEAELAAYDEVVRVLEGLGGATADGASPVGLAVFEATLREALDVPAGRHGKLGEGVFTGTVAEAAGMGFDHVFVLGMAERVFPPQPSDDPLLPERLRRELDGAVPSAAERLVEARRAYLAVAASAGTCVVTAPRVSLRDQRPAQPSRWFLEAAGVLNGGPVYGRDLERWGREPAARPGWLTVVDSFAAWIKAGDGFADVHERDLAEVSRATAEPWRHRLLVELGVQDGITARAERSRMSAAGGSPGIGPWTGAAIGRRLEPGIEFSASALEALTSCPFRFFLGHELRVREAERPEELDTIEPATRGSLVHEVLERFVLEVKQQRHAEVIAGEWTEGERRLLLELADRAFAEYERRGVTGRPASWSATKERIRQDLARFLDEDWRWRAQEGTAIRDAELAFGGGSERTVEYEVGPGRRIAFRGKADRVDVRQDGGLVVIDYKTGSADSFRAAKGSQLAKQDGGWLLQLPIYALAAGQGGGTPPRALYWFISEEGEFERREVTLDSSTEEQFRRVVGEAMALREQGLYPAIAGPPKFDRWHNCRFCPFDRVCPGSDRERLWERWKQDPRLKQFVAVVLREGEPAAEEGEA
ncbi:PD-(D/E)XK nuclease family protein [Tepidiforma thermophila]|uniref:PD-(D/E)XK nuclease superfamily protein n=1 Tax=Tepidiforma thermophila (strain KCTC 52669 / CGMCC 1.13589 / G233) TaxID=2761530 RepID=A0A2A9HKA2_TEPT2|nr:PD-(D/E)XK nuclease family protein [Tepidiforma thermophila]PFG75299.1 PD-(D/E)XK nuclease superfamily protein [Tepidiforma thermophila]